MASLLSAKPDYNLYARTKLKNLETQFLTSLHDDDSEGQMLDLFFGSYSEFQDELKSLHPHLDAKTKEDIAHFATVVVTISTNLAEATSPTIVDDFKVHLLGTMSPSHSNLASEQQASQQSTRYIADSLRWLRRNIQNPYPPRAVRNSIAQRNESPIKDVDAWFVDARKRIGWSRLRRSRFNNRKADILDAAKRFFTSAEPHRPLDGIVESAFASIAATVEELYQEKCARSSLASHLDDTVRDLTPDLQQSLSKQKQQAQFEIRQSRTVPRHPHPYPTPERSPTLSSRTLCTPEPASPTLALPSTSENRRKRSRSSSSECPTDVEEEQARPTKRTRLVSRSLARGDVKDTKARCSPIPTLHTPPASCYPSPAASIVTDLTEPPRQAPVSSEVEPTSHIGKRKRTLSDTGIVRAPPPRESASQPRTSSDPPPISVSEIMDPTAFCPPSPSAVPSATSSPFAPFDPFFSAFMSGGAPALGDTSSPLPLFNIVDDVAPTNVHVEFDQSWLSSSADALAPSYNPYTTGFNTNFDNFGGNLYAGTMDPFNSPLWYGNPPLQPLASAPCPSSSAMALASQHDASLPSPATLYHVSSPLLSSPTSLPHSDLRTDTDKARELLELEARCATLRSELAAGRSGVSILP